MFDEHAQIRAAESGLHEGFPPFFGPAPYGPFRPVLAVSGLLTAGQPPFRLFTTEDGLVRNWIEHIRTDSRGYLWFCTVEGISVFDGSHFTNFTVRDGLPNRLVMDVVESWTGDYWIATADGLSFSTLLQKPGAAISRTSA